ncbi:unnamed protein product [Prorocentrum cordatum]|uniref:Uncharacterized protein n=1 Tax=Prorocentrum cordatum TaxID=2364126 RepID=A0ABN9VPF3_9DINO|nr:unnamed protein product [Polarella glacialis]
MQSNRDKDLLKLKAHLKNVERATNLNQKTAATCDDGALMEALRAMEKIKQPLPRATLLGLLQRYTDKLAQSILLNGRNEDVERLWAAVVPFGPEQAHKSIVVREPKMFVLTNVFEPSDLVDIFNRAIMQGVVVPLINGTTKASDEKFITLHRACQAGLKALDIPEDGDIEEEFLTLALNVSTCLKALVCFMCPDLGSDGDFDGYEAVSDLCDSTTQGEGNRMVNIGNSIVGNEYLGPLFAKLADAKGAIIANGREIQEVVSVAIKSTSSIPEDRLHSISAALVGCETHQQSLPHECLIGLPKKVLELLEGLVNDALNENTVAPFTADQLAELQRVISKGSHVFPLESKMDAWTEAVGLKLHESGKNDYSTSLVKLVDLVWDKLEPKDLAEKLTSLRAWTWRHDVEFTDEIAAQLANARLEMLKMVWVAMGRTDADEKSSQIDALLTWTGHLASTVADEPTRRFHTKQNHLYKTTKTALMALTAVKASGGDVVERVKNDKDMSKSRRALRADESLAKAVNLVKACSETWDENVLVENLDTELSQLMPEIGTQKVKLLLDGVQEQMDTVRTFKGGHPDGDGRSWQVGIPPDSEPWEAFVTHCKGTLLQVNLERLEKSLEDIERVSAAVATLFTEYMPEFKDAYAVDREEVMKECQLTVAAHRVMNAIATVTDKVVLRTTLKDTTQNYMVNRKLKVAEFPERLAKAVSQGLKQQTIKG